MSAKSPARRILIVEPAPAELGIREIERYLELGLSVTVNINGAFDPSSIRSAFTGRVEFAELEFNEDAVIAYAQSRRGFEIIKLRQNFPLTAKFFSALTASPLELRPLGIVAQAGSGILHIDLSSAAKHGVKVLNTPGVNAQGVAEHVIRAMLELASRSHEYAAITARGEWSKGRFGPNSELHGKTLGLVGMGASAKRTALIAVAFGMQIIGFGGSRFNDAAAAELGVTRAGSLQELLRQSDYVSLHVPLSDETRNLIGRAEIALMKKGARLINISRGGVVDEEAVAADLNSPNGRLGGAAFDVFLKEGKGFTTPLLGIPRVVLTPHIAGSSRESLGRVTEDLFDQIARELVGN